MVKPPCSAPNTAPPLNVELMAPIVGDDPSVLKYLRKFAEAIYTGYWLDFM
jgi:hypothetical protein